MNLQAARDGVQLGWWVNEAWKGRIGHAGCDRSDLPDVGLSEA